jgi:transitional endoplasmic reticulum ATPase
MQQGEDGLDKKVSQLKALVALNSRFRDLCDHLGIIPPMGILLCGSPGVCASFLAEALTNDIRASSYAIHGSEIMSLVYVSGERILRDVFAQAEKNAPSVVLIHEIDFIAPSRQKSGNEGIEQSLVATLLTLMDRIRSSRGVIVIGTTDFIKDIDPVLRQPGRFEEEIYIGNSNSGGE